MAIARSQKKTGRTAEIVLAAGGLPEAVLDGITDGVLVLSRDFRILWANRAALRHIGLSKEDVLGRFCYSVTHARSSRCEGPLDVCPIREYLERGRTEPVLHTHFRKDGTSWYAEITAYPVRDGKGNILHFVYISRDVTEHISFMNQLRVKENAIAACMVGIVLVDLQNRVTYANPAALRLAGLMSADEALGKNIYDFFADDSLSRTVESTTKERGCWQGEVLLRRADGSDVPVEASARMVTDEQGKPFFFTASFVDITARKIAEEVLKRDKEDFSRQVEERSNELLRANMELENSRRLAGMGMFAATVAHELKNPLGVIKTAMFNIRRKAQNPNIESNLSNVEKKVMEADQIISNLLFYSRIKPPRYEKVNVYDVIMDCLSTARARYRARKVVVHRGLRAIRNTTIDADAVQLKELFGNIINNAYEALAETPGRIEVRAGIEEPGALVVECKDSGPGIPPAALEKLFEPFFTTKVRGTGLGLAICREILRLHKGAISASSTPGQGTTIKVSLPRSLCT